MSPEARPWLARSLPVALAVLALAATHLHAASQNQIRTPTVPGGKTPAVLEQIGATDALLAFAISGDGLQAALASESAIKPDQTELRLFSTALDEPRSSQLPGRVRDLLFSTDGGVLFGILHRVAKRTGGDTHLVLIDPATLKMKRANRLPLGATDLDHWVSARALLIAGPAEIRTLLLPDLRSGPLFPVTGANRAIASLGGSSLVLVGQENGLDLVDLEDRPGIEEMPVREHLATAAAVDGIAAATDGNSALARLADGSLHTVEFRPLRARPAGRGAAVAAPPVARVIRARERSFEEPPATTVAPSPERAPAEPEPVEAQDPTPPPQTAQPRKAPVQPPPAIPRPTPPASTKEPEGKPVVAPPAAPPPRPAATPDPPGDAQLSGRVTGAASHLVQFVVLRGPNNLLREAARLVPSADGSFSAEGLAAGRYRMQLDAGGGRVLVSRPPYVMIDVIEGRQVTVPDIEAVRAL